MSEEVSNVTFGKSHTVPATEDASIAPQVPKCKFTDKEDKCHSCETVLPWAVVDSATNDRGAEKLASAFKPPIPTSDALSLIGT